MKKHLLKSFLFLAALILFFQLAYHLEKDSVLTTTSFNCNNPSDKSYNNVVSTLCSDGDSGQITKSEQIIQVGVL